MNDAPQTEPTTVAQLIENLSGYPGDAVVLVNAGPCRPFQSPGTTEIYFYEDDNIVGLRGVLGPADDTGSAG